MSYYVYVMVDKAYGSMFVGRTTNLIKRVNEHRKNLIPGFSGKYSTKRLVYYEEFDNYNLAASREALFNKWLGRDWLIGIIRTKNPTWRDLFSDLVVTN